MKFQITQQNIDNGKRYEALNCVVSLSIKEGFKQKVTVMVDGDSAVIWDSFFWLIGRFALPQTIKDFVEDFDLHKTVYPTEFELEIPDEYTQNETTTTDQLATTQRGYC